MLASRGFGNGPCQSTLFCIAAIQGRFAITDEEALYIRQVTEEKVADPVIRGTGTAHRDDGVYLDGAYRVQVNGANEVLNIRVVSIGLIDRSPVHPREVFADALADRASAVIVAHNHPGGGVEPSHSDITITSQLKAAGAIVGIDLLDHIIFNRTGHYSFLEDGKL